ncbi:MAG: Hpt domain-containing protein, partial [Desulfuromonadaceae bacterium]
LGCQNSGCHRHGQSSNFPCWLDVGYIGSGNQTCPHAGSEQECKNCPVFQQINGNIETINAIFRLFHSMKGSAGFLDLTNLSGVAHAAESLLDLVRSGKIELDPSYVTLLCQSCDFAKEALDLVENEYTDQSTETIAAEVTEKLKQAAEDALEKVARAAETPSASAEPVAAVDQPVPSTAKEAPEFELEITAEMVERFTQEADELLQNAEQNLLKWTEAQPEPEVIVPG